MTTQPHIFKLATSAQETQAYFALRHSIFVEEQGLFQDSDVDELDAIAYPIIAIKTSTPNAIGVVRMPTLGDASGSWQRCNCKTCDSFNDCIGSQWMRSLFAIAPIT